MEKPKKLAEIIFKTLSPHEKQKLKNNLPYYGKIIFSNMGYNDEQVQEFKKELSKLLEGE